MYILVEKSGKRKESMDHKLFTLLASRFLSWIVLSQIYYRVKNKKNASSVAITVFALGSL